MLPVEQPSPAQQGNAIRLPTLLGKLGAHFRHGGTRQLLVEQMTCLAVQGVVAVGAKPGLLCAQVKFQGQLPVPKRSVQMIADQQVQLPEGAALVAKGQITGDSLQIVAGIHQGADPLLEHQPQSSRWRVCLQA